MRSSTLKWIVVLSTLLVAIIIAVQVYWLNKVYSLEERQFNTNVVKSVRGLLEDLSLASFPGIELQKLIEHPDPNTFRIRIESFPAKDSLVFFLVNEFEDFGVLADCKMSVYDHARNRYLYEAYLPAATFHRTENEDAVVPPVKREYPYINLYFPNREKYILGQLSFWIVAAILLITALTGFSASMFFLYRQKTLNEIQRDFVNNFTHEFKTPLAVMKLATDVLIGDAIIRQPERLKRYSSIVKEQTAHLQHQVERLLTTATSDHNRLKLEKENFEMNALINDVLHQVEPMIKEKSASVNLELDENNTRITADRFHIGMVLVNLLENAIKYSDHPHIIIKTAEQEDAYTVSVKDNGVGIEKKYLRFLFKKFFRVPTGNVHNVKGFGLGLNFVKQVVDTHKGKIIVNSLPGIGTEFKISLPK